MPTPPRGHPAARPAAARRRRLHRASGRAVRARRCHDKRIGSARRLRPPPSAAPPPAVSRAAARAAPTQCR
eukprot:6586464-Prymnesium_polylepis.3